MIFDFAAPEDGKPNVYTVVYHEPTGYFVKVGAKEEELFRAALGDEEFERRVKAAALKAKETAEWEGYYAEYCPYSPPRWWEFWK